MKFGDTTGAITGAAIEVHRELGPGLLESAYEACLFYELTQRGLDVLRQVELPIAYKGHISKDKVGHNRPKQSNCLSAVVRVAACRAKLDQVATGFGQRVQLRSRSPT